MEPSENSNSFNKKTDMSNLPEMNYLLLSEQQNMTDQKASKFRDVDQLMDDLNNSGMNYILRNNNKIASSPRISPNLEERNLQINSHFGGHQLDHQPIGVFTGMGNSQHRDLSFSHWQPPLTLQDNVNNNMFNNNNSFYNNTTFNNSSNSHGPSHHPIIRINTDNSSSSSSIRNKSNNNSNNNSTNNSNNSSFYSSRDSRDDWSHSSPRFNIHQQHQQHQHQHQHQQQHQKAHHQLHQQHGLPSPRNLPSHGSFGSLHQHQQQHLNMHQMQQQQQLQMQSQMQHSLSQEHLTPRSFTSSSGSPKSLSGAGASHAGGAAAFTSQSTPSINGTVVLEDGCDVYKVQFKRSHRFYVSPPPSYNSPPAVYTVADFVVVECEGRGEDLGVVVEVLSKEAYLTMRRQEVIFETAEESIVGDVRHVKHRATAAERGRLVEKFQDEKNALEFCLYLLKHVYLLPIKIIGVEYQFDRTKMFVYYTASNRVDFRELVKTIFGKCKVRIWMIKVNRNDSFAPLKFAEIALSTGSTVFP